MPVLLALLLLLAPAAAQAQFTYTTNGDAITITGYTGPGGAVAIPATITGLPVTSINYNAFQAGNLTSVSIPSSVTSMEADLVFAYSPNLTSITVDPQNPVYSSLNGVLFDKSQSTLIQYPEGLVGSYTVPGSVSTIENGALEDCGGLTSLTIPGTVTIIEDTAICYCPNLGSITIAGTIDRMPDDLFSGCGKLTNVYFLGNAPTITPVQDYVLAPMFYGDSKATAYYFAGATGWSNTIGAISSFWYGGNYVGIPAVAFAATASDEFDYTTNDGAITITGYACSGGLVVIPGRINGLPVTAIGANAFAFCTNLTIVAIPGSVTNIGSGAFEFCTGLAYVAILPGVASIGEEAFAGCYSLESVIIPASVTSIGNNAFDSCSGLGYVYFYCNAPTVGQELFNNSSVSTVYYSPCTTGWGATLGGTPAMAVTPPDQFDYVSSGGGSILHQYSGTCGNLVIPSNLAGWPVTCVGDLGSYPGVPFAEGNTILTSVAIPGSVTNILDYAFESCSNLGSVTIEEGVTTTGEWVFANCGNLTNVSLPASLTNIGPFMFNGCSGMTTLPSNITTLGVGEFAYSGLTNITIPDSISSIPGDAFIGCNSLTNVTFHDGLTSIAPYSFYGDALTSVTIPASVTLIGGDAFKFCCDLTNVYFQGNAPSVSGGAEVVFFYDLNATAYYLPGTTGWSSTYQGIPAVLWNPQVQTGDGKFGVKNGQFGFDIAGTPGIPIVVEGCTSLGNPVWTALTNGRLTNGLFYFSEPAQANSAGRYYRIRSP